ncbi:MAG: NAD(P)-dependent oxidoreductase [Candidatus Limnocylindrales bacterium]
MDNVASERIGFLGLGTMGAAMAGHLQRARGPIRVWNRSPGRAPELVAAGAIEAATPAELATASDLIVMCVSDTPDVEAILFGPDGVAGAARPGTLVIDCSTIAPGATRDMAGRLAGAGVDFADAPVSGGSEGAQKATLTIFVGADLAVFERARPVLEVIGRTITHVGPIGSGQAVKAVNQVIIAGAYLGVAEGIVLAMKAGLDVEQVVGALGGGAAQSWVLANRSGRMLANDYPLGFKVALHLKDLGIALGLAGELGVQLPVTELCAEIERELAAAGHADEDMSAVARHVRAEAHLPD